MSRHDRHPARQHPKRHQAPEQTAAVAANWEDGSSSGSGAPLPTGPSTDAPPFRSAAVAQGPSRRSRGQAAAALRRTAVLAAGAPKPGQAAGALRRAAGLAAGQE